MFLAKRYIRTNHGVSSHNIGNTREHQLHGIGQGNGGGPAIWLSHLAVIFKALSSVCTGLYTSCIENKRQCTTIGTGCVDDVTLVMSIPKGTSQTVNMVRKMIQRMAQLWDQLLFITGGRLELTKCFWVPIEWIWKQGKPRMKKPGPVSKRFKLIESETGLPIEIPRQNGSKSNKRLGVTSSCDAKWTEEFKTLQQSAITFGNKIRRAKIGRIAGYHSYHSMWIAKRRYSASVIGISPRQMY